MFPFTFRQLEVLSEVLKAGSFGQAAENLGISQPAVSRQIAALEYQLGTSLFHRVDGGAPRLTSLGKDFAEDMYRFLAMGRAMTVKYKRKPEKQKPSYRIYIDPYVMQRNIFPNMARLNVLSQTVELIINPAQELLYTLPDIHIHEFDFAIYSTTKSAEALLPGVTLLDEEGSGIFGHRKLIGTDMTLWPFLVPPRASPFEAKMLDLIAQGVGFVPTRTVPLMGYGGLEVQYIEEGNAVTYQMEHDIESYSDNIVKLRPCQDWMLLYYRRPGVDEEVADALADFFMSCANGRWKMPKFAQA